MHSFQENSLKLGTNPKTAILGFKLSKLQTVYFFLSGSRLESKFKKTLPNFLLLGKEIPGH